jgi:putative Mg2+ transporter-C (MgtC) family protein
MPVVVHGTTAACPSNLRDRYLDVGANARSCAVTMPLYVTWQDAAIRLILTVIAAAAIGYNREIGGHPAGLRTTVLVGLAAAVAMIQANVLLTVGGKAADSFGVMDLMRLPLGILTGVGFIGAGAILRRGDLLTGVTTAATMWVVTVIALCFGGGQLALGTAGTVLALVTLWLLKPLDLQIRRERRAVLSIVAASDAEGMDVANTIRAKGYQARLLRIDRRQNTPDRILSLEIRWKAAEFGDPPPELMRLISDTYRIDSIQFGDEIHH